VTSQSADLGALSADQRELLELLLRQQGVEATRALAIPRVAARDAPLSSAQRRLWLTEQLVAGSPHPNPHIIHHVFRVRGTLDVGALDRALAALAARHEIVRTTYTVVDGEPRQIVAAEAAPAAVVAADVRGLEPGAREREAEARVAAEVRRPFELSTGPLVRVLALQLGDDEWRVAVTLHLMVADGLSDGLLLAELRALYARELGTDDALPALAVQYGDYARWQPGALAVVHDEELAYWRERLRGAPARLALPADRTAPAVPTFRGSFLPFALPGELSDRLRALCRKHGVTPFMAFVAALQALLHGYSGQDDLVVATTVSTRPRAELEPQLGSFANVLMLRTSFVGGPNWSELLERVRETAIGAVAHQETPVEDVLTALLLDPTIGSAPQLQVMVVLHEHTAEHDFALPGARVESLPVDRGGALYELYLRMADVDEGFTGSLEFGADVFDAPTVERMLADLATVIERMVAEPGTAADGVPTSPLAGRLPQRTVAAAARVAPDAAVAAPRSESEHAIAAIWREVLGLEVVGIDESFFELGGRSLQLVLVSNRVQERFGRVVPIVALFEHPTVRALAAYLAGDDRVAASVGAEIERAAARRAARQRRASVRERGDGRDEGSDD
jgi:acyl carrier protein